MRKTLMISVVLVSSFAIGCCPRNGPTGSAAIGGANKLDEAKAKEVLEKYLERKNSFTLTKLSPFYPDGVKINVTFAGMEQINANFAGTEKRGIPGEGQAVFQVAQDGKWYLVQTYLQGHGSPSQPNLKIE